MLKVDMYTDGSCLKNPNGPGGCAVILRYEKDGKPYVKKKSVPSDNTTNNRMELSAIITGFELLPAQADITVYSDSKYVVDAFRKRWVDNWQRINWDRGKNGGPVKNPDLWKKLLFLMKNHKVRYVWVKGHNGHTFNEECDKMAVTAAIKQKGTYKEGTVKEPIENTKPVANKNSRNTETQKPKDHAPKFHSQPEIQCVAQAPDTLDIDKILGTDSFVIIPTGTYHSEDKTGTYKYLLNYKNLFRVYEGEVKACRSVNEAVLKGIEDGVGRIRYSNRKITVITANVLGFSNPIKSVNFSLIQSIKSTCSKMGNEIQVVEVKSGMRQLKSKIKEYEE